MVELPKYIYKDLFNKSKEIFFTLKPDLKILDANQMAIQTYGYSLKEFSEMNCSDLFAKEARIGLAQIKSKFYVSERVFKTIHISKNRNIFPVEVLSMKVGYENTFFFLVMINLDLTTIDTGRILSITAKKSLELADNLNEAVIIRNGADLIFSNQSCAKIWGITGNDLKADSRLYLKCIYPEDLEQLIYSGKIVDFEETEELNVEVRVVREDRSVLWILLRTVFVMFSEISTPCTMVLATDITERKETAAEVFSRLIEVEEIQKSKISKDIHDEIGPLLSTIRLYLNLIRKKNSADNESENLIVNAIELTDMAIVSTRNIANELSPLILKDFGLKIALETILNKMKEASGIMINARIKLFNRRFELSIEKNLFRICLELLNNTMKYSGADRIDFNMFQENKMLLLYYQDNGRGFDVKHVLGNQKGGQGLHNIINRVRAMNGICEINSSEGEGTRVVVSLMNCAAIEE